MKPIEEALREIELFADLPDEAIKWLIANTQSVHFDAGEITVLQGAPAEHMYILLEGEIEARTEPGTPPLPPFIARAPQVTGLLPHSRMKTMARTVRTTVPTHVLQLHKNRFDEMLDRIPELDKRLIAIMADRIRDTTRMDLQHEKLSALGKLAAGLAHELNNPAAAVARNIKTLREKLVDLLSTNEFEREALQKARSSEPLNALERSDREEELGTWLSEAGVEDAWDLAIELVDAGFTRETAAGVPPESLRRAAMSISLDRLAADIEHASCRISELVRSVKEYSYMDTAAEREIDVHAGLDNTLTMLSHNLRGITIERDYDPELPLLCGHGAELNQVWTNLIDNAADAMADSELKRLRVRTAFRGDKILVEIDDTGSGIPPEISSRIFEPFFTTKRQGDGTGLGLDTVFRIVKKHNGDVRFESKPGSTCFQVSLPLSRPQVPL
jgi:signal transduction histidine kinase